MPTQRPLILVNGEVQEMPGTDSLEVFVLDVLDRLQVEHVEGAVSYISSDDVTLGNTDSFIALREDETNQWHSHPNDLMLDTTGRAQLGDPQGFANKTYVEAWDAEPGGPRIRLNCIGNVYIGDTEQVVNGTQFIVDDANQQFIFDTNDSIGFSSIKFPEFGGGVTIGETSSDLFAFWGVGGQPQPSIGSHTPASFTANSGTAVNDASTFDGYTIKQIVGSLRGIGLLA